VARLHATCHPATDPPLQTLALRLEVEQIIGQRLMHFLAPADVSVVSDASRALVEDADAHIAHVRFRLQVSRDLRSVCQGRCLPPFPPPPPSLVLRNRSSRTRSTSSPTGSQAPSTLRWRAQAC